MNPKHYEVFALQARSHGLEAAVDAVLSFGLPDDKVEELRSKYEEDCKKIVEVNPPAIRNARSTWYAGPQKNDKNWTALKRYFLEEDHWSEARLNSVDQSSSKVMALTPCPTADGAWQGKGLVVGYVQSGKTTNFTSVIAKAADCGYRLVIVLSGIHNGLRRQTQERLVTQLSAFNPDSWPPLTTPVRDFKKPPMSVAQLLQPGSTSTGLAVVKKHKSPLKHLVAWLGEADEQHALSSLPTLIIDDEADQAGVQTNTINPLLKELLEVLPRATYIGYTATPFANVLIDPKAEDLYPEDFIVNLPRPSGYFGPERIFGRDLLPEEDPRVPLDGHDMVRIIDERELDDLRPKNRAAVPAFKPQVTDSLRDAMRWFWMATATRRARGDIGHSTMLVHTTLRSGVHEQFKLPLVEERDSIRQRLSTDEEQLKSEFKSLWDRETMRVRAEEFGEGLKPVSFQSMWAELSDVVGATRVIVDNCYSDDRLDYSTPSQVAVAIGGNTLSRGLTLEGLVVSLFVRSATAYDTLLQMGRWFGYRTGYEDLPRIWMTEDLRHQFRHLAMVEHEIRQDIEYLETQNLTPLEFGVRIQTHPKLSITAKMGAAAPDSASYGGQRLQTRYFRVEDAEWLQKNLAAADRLVAKVRADNPGDEPLNGEDHPESGSRLFRGVAPEHVLAFLEEYQVHTESPEMAPRFLTKYITRKLRVDELQNWNVAVMAGPVRDDESSVTLGGRNFRTLVRSRLPEHKDDAADIKSLMSKEHRALDLTSYDPTAFRKKSERALRDLRTDEPGRPALLVIYPIDRFSPPVNEESGRLPLDAKNEVIGIGLVFPDSISGERSYVSVELDGGGLEPDLTPEEREEMLDVRAEQESILGEA